MALPSWNVPRNATLTCRLSWSRPSTTFRSLCRRCAMGRTTTCSSLSSASNYWPRSAVRWRIAASRKRMMPIAPISRRSLPPAPSNGNPPFPTSRSPMTSRSKPWAMRSTSRMPRPKAIPDASPHSPSPSRAKWACRNRLRPPGALRRTRLSPRPEGRRDPPWRAHVLYRRHPRRHDLRPPLPPGTNISGCPQGKRTLVRPPVRPQARQGVPRNARQYLGRPAERYQWPKSNFPQGVTTDIGLSLRRQPRTLTSTPANLSGIVYPHRLIQPSQVDPNGPHCGGVLPFWVNNLCPPECACSHLAGRGSTALLPLPQRTRSGASPTAPLARRFSPFHFFNLQFGNIAAF